MEDDGDPVVFTVFIVVLVIADVAVAVAVTLLLLLLLLGGYNNARSSSSPVWKPD